MTVAEIQRALLARGYDLGPPGVDGDAGPRTIAAVTAFQRAAGLVADGIAGPKTHPGERRSRAPAAACHGRHRRCAGPLPAGAP